jgi:hypothetical protein
MKNHFKMEVQVMWRLAAIAVVVAFAAASIVPHLAS